MTADHTTTANVFRWCARHIGPGAHVVQWAAIDELMRRGDGLFVDPTQANLRWRAMADVLVYPQPMTNSDAGALARNVFATCCPVLVVANLGRCQWFVGCFDGHGITVDMSDRGCTCPLGWAALLYRWVLTGRHLPQCPATINWPAVRPAPSDGPE